MKNNILKISLVSLLTGSLCAGEIQIGKGTFELTGGFIGLDQTIQTDITTYSMVEQHAPLFGSESWFYKYNFTWYDSKEMVQAQNTINGILTTTPSIDYRLQGLDLNLAVGKDFYHTDENNYIGGGIMLGISTPWIDSGKNSDNDDSTSDIIMNNMQNSKTEILTYKIGPSITGRISLNDFFTLYGSGTYAYQTGTFKNDYANSDLTVNGIFQEYDFGIRFQPVSSDYKFGWITISPRLYATLGYRYTSWDLNDVNIDVTGTNTTFTQSDLNMNSSISYFSLGYSF